LNEFRKLAHPAKVIAIHIKPTYFKQVVEELMALGLPNLEIGVPGKEYSF
jgi:hypothetical protein